MKKTFLAIIPARGGSKRLINKNRLLLDGKPLIEWTLNAAKNSRLLDKIIVSTDSKEIKKITENNKIDVPFLRPDYLSTDKSSSESAVIHALDWLENNEKIFFDYVVLLQPTSPFRTGDYIDKTIDMILKEKTADCLVSTKKIDKRLYLIKSINTKGYLTDFLVQYNTKRKCSNIPKLVVPNGAIYIIKVDILKQFKTFYPPKTITFEMDTISSLDIDTKEDFELAQLVANKKYGKK
jgi:CMP-N,N'-diacetyllegionaminic acid synthase